MDWNNYNTSTSDYVRINWAIATVLSSTIMAMAMLYIVTEWCLQSHLSTANMSDAARGLYLTRHFRWLTSPFRDAVHYAIEAVYAIRNLFTHDGTANGTAASRQHRRSVRWTKISTKDAQHKTLEDDVSLENWTHGRLRASSDAPLMGSDDGRVSPSSLTDADAASQHSQGGGLQSQRLNNENRTVPPIESPSRLNVPDVRHTSDRRLSV
jgi:hypothetical protein